MSEHTRHKMIDFEATPPPAAWMAIAARLDDDKQHAAVATKINNFEAAPPHAAWEFIVARLDDDKQYEGVSTKMNNFDTPPPRQIWNNIAATLKESKEVITPVTNIRRLVYRIAAAAILIGLFIGGWMIINKNAVKIEVAKTNITSTPFPPAIKEENKVTATDNFNNHKEVAAAQHQSVQNNIKTRYPLSSFSDNKDHVLKYAIVSGLPAYQENPIVISSSPILDKDGAVIRDMDVLTTSNYLNITGPNGQSTRISSKFANVIRYLNGSHEDTEEYLDRVIKESDTWKRRFQEWRNKISQSPFIPSSVNFLDIIEFKDLILEK